LDDDPDVKPSQQLIDLVSRALVDEELRDRLFADPEAVARTLDLPPREAEAIRLLDRAKFERTVVWLRWS
jgi:hypothetical protein